MAVVSPSIPDEAPSRRHRSRLRIAVLLALATLVLAATGWFAYFWLTRDMGSGPAGAAVASQPFAEPWSRRPVLLLGIGDSVTKGFGASAWKSYFQRLAHIPPDEFGDMSGRTLSAVFPNLETRNEAVSGSTSPEHLERIRRLPVFPKETFGQVVMTSGGNDIIHDYGRSSPKKPRCTEPPWSRPSPGSATTKSGWTPW